MRILLSTLLLSLCFSAFAKSKATKVIMETTKGTIELELFDNTPKHKANFEKLVKEKFYDGTLFHRVITEFMIQGGDPNSKDARAGQALGSGDIGYKIDAEFNKDNVHIRGALAAARDNNPERASSGCQFYIVVGKKYSPGDLENISRRNGMQYTEAQKKAYETEGGTPFLDNNYTVFGKVTKGMEVVDKIVSVPRNSMDRPDEDVKMTKVYIKKKKKFLFF